MRLRKKRGLPREEGGRKGKLVCWRSSSDIHLTTSGMPQDQEGASGHQGNLVVVLNGTMTDDRNGDEKKVPYSNGTETKTTQQAEPRAEQQVEQRSDLKQEDAAHLLGANDERVYRQGNWIPSETLVLLEAKRKEQDMFSGSRRSVLTADDKWKFVSDYCRTKGVQRSKEQCRFKWENMLPDYRKIREYEEQKEAGAQSYFDMESWERKSKLLPSNMDLDVYQRIGMIMSNKPTKGGLSGLKREAREKKFPDAAAPTQATRQVGDGGDVAGVGVLGIRNGGNGVEVEGEALVRPWEERAKDVAVADFVGRHLAAGPKKRRRKRRVVERVLPPEGRFTREVEPESRNNSSTEEDTAVMAGRSEGRPPVAYMYDESASAAPHLLRVDNRDAAAALVAAAYRPQDPAAAFRQAQNGQADRCSPSEPRDEKAGSIDPPTGLRDCERSAELLTYIEDRKDARHKELLALEREKLAAFREASFTIASAMNNAIAVFSKVAEELLRRR